VEHWEDMIEERSQKILKSTLEIENLKKQTPSTNIEKADLLEKIQNLRNSIQTMEKETKVLTEELTKKRSDRENLNEGDVYYSR